MDGLFGPPTEWVFLDPDNRRNPPETGLWYCRCNKRLKTNETGIVCDVSYEVPGNEDAPMVRLNPLGKSIIGSYCWNEINKP